MKEEDKLKKMVGMGTPFRVPDGYFDSLTSQVMSCLPESELPAKTFKPVTRRLRIRPWLVGAAAVLAGAVLLLRFASSPSVSIDDTLVADETELEMEYINMAVENSLLSDYELYIYLADSESEY